MTLIDLPRVGSGEPGITLDRVRFGYDEHLLVSGLSWELDQGRSAIITGANGCGKSTFLQIAAGLLMPQSGTVLLSGHPVGPLLPSERVSRGLRTGFVFQEGGLLANLNVYSNVELPLLYHRDVLELDSEGIRERTEEALALTHIGEKYWQTLPAHLSYGDRKRLALARAIALRPNFFFFDDPDVGMDQRTARVTHDILCQLRDDPQVTMLVATNRTLLMERLGIPGLRLHEGLLSAADSTSSFPPPTNLNK